MPKTLEAHDKLIHEIFGGSYQFEIPDYQRPYSWTTDQVEELFNDLVLAMSDSQRAQLTRQYFLGSIVLIKADGEAKSYVVDGQQRLTTLTILFAVLRVVMTHAVEDLTEFLYKRGRASLDEINEYRLTVREEDADFFRTYIQEIDGITKLVESVEPLKDSRLRFRENAALLLDKIRLLSTGDRSSLWRFIARDCSLVIISTPDLDAAYRIFSVLNNRGLDLAPVDILKADILGAIRRTNEVEGVRCAKLWVKIEGSLGRDAFGELFSHVRTIYTKQKQRATLVKEFQEHVPEYHQSPIELIEVVIKPYAEVWSFIRDSAFETTEHAEIINDFLSSLNRVDFKDWVPPALVFFKRFRQQPQLLANFFHRLERLTYFLLISKVGINERIDIFAKLTKEIESKTFNGDLLAINEFELQNGQKQEFLTALDGDIYERHPKARMAILLRLEALVSDGSKKPEFSNLSLEHVLPQTPPEQSEWLRWFPDESLRTAWTHRLANLVPLHRRKNSDAYNFDFATKKDVYFKGKGTSSPFVLTNQVRDHVEWTPRLLEHRQQQLLSAFCKHWSLNQDEKMPLSY